MQVGRALGCGADGIDHDVVDVLMRDQHSIGALERIWRRKRPGVDHQCLAGLFEAYARVAELAEPHTSSSIPRPLAKAESGAAAR